MTVSFARALFLAAALCSSALGAWASDIHEFDIPGGNAELAITEFSLQAHRQIVVAGDLSGIRTPPIRGNFDPEAVLAILLKNTDLVVVSDDGRTIVVTSKWTYAETNAGGEQHASNLAVAERVTVTGYRLAVVSATNSKRSATGLSDAIFAEDIGKFPDSNLAAALMRVPGVTITRAASSQVTTTGEPTQVTVRGFGPTFNEILFEGRKIPSGAGGRAFDFSGLSADMVSELQVFKTPDPSLSAGAIGATINVLYPKPFDKDGFNLVASVSETASPDDGRITPNANFLLSDTIADGKIGYLIAGAFSSLRTTQNQVSNWGWEGAYLDPCQLSGAIAACGATLTTNSAKPVWFTQDYAIDYNQIREQRKNARLALQFLPSNALLVTLDANYARNDLAESQWAYAIWNNVTEMRNVTTSPYGTIVDFTRFAPTDFDNNTKYAVQQTYDFGVNVKYSAGANFSLMADYDLAMSALNPDGHLGELDMDIGYGPSRAGGTNGMNVRIIMPGGHTLPYYLDYGPNSDQTRFLDTSIMGSHVAVMTAQQNRNLVNQAKLEAAWSDENLTVKIGGHYVTDHYKMNNYNTFANNQWQVYAGYGPDSNNYYSSGPDAGLPAGVHIPAQYFEGTIKISPIAGWQTVQMIPGLPKFNAANIYSYLESLGDPVSPTQIPGFNWGCCNPPYHGTISMVQDVQQFQHVYEDTYAVYVSVAAGTSVAGIPLKLSTGARFEYTDLLSSGIGRPLMGMLINAADHTAYDFVYGGTTALRAHNSYQYLLPNADVILQATDQLQFRFDVSRTLTRPPLANLNPSISYGGRTGSLTSSGGNPRLQPYLSDNADISAEWYYAPNSYVAGNAFLKRVTNFIVSSTTRQVLSNVIDPYTNQPAVFAFSSTVNGPRADVYGLEVTWQHLFETSGFGVQANATVLQSDKPYNPYDLTTSEFAVTGLADSANIVAFYDKRGIEIRLAANWRDTYLDHFGQGQNASAFGTEPTFVNTGWTLDSSMGYQITQNLNAYFEATNILNQSFGTRGRFPDQVLDVVSYGRRFTLGLHCRI